MSEEKNKQRYTERKLWNPEEDAVVLARYADNPTSEIARDLRRSGSSVYQRAVKFGLSKSAAYLRSAHSGRLNSGIGVRFRFKPGNVPFNKGLVRPLGWAPGRTAETRFKHGNKPQTWRPVGSERWTRDGYLERKISDTGNKRDWSGAHVILWEDINGPIPKGHAVIFRDGNKRNIIIENLELISRADLMRRNSVYALPKELALVIQLRGALNRQIRKRENAKEQHGRPEESPIRNTGITQG